MGQNKIPNRLLIIGNGFDLNLGRNTRYSDFAKSEFWPKNMESQLYGYLNKKYQIERWFDLEGELATYVTKLNAQRLVSYRSTISNIAKQDEHDFQIIVEAMISYLSLIEEHTNPKEPSLAAKVFSLICRDRAFQKVYSFNYTDLSRLADWLSLEREPLFEYVHGCLANHSAILGINDSVDTIDGNYDFLRKSFNSHYASHPIAYDLHDVDEVVFFGHSLGDNDYHYFQSFFRQQCKENMERKDGRDITIFTYNEKSRMEIMHTLHKMNEGQTSLLFQNNNLRIFCTEDEEKNESEAFKNWCECLREESVRLDDVDFFDGMN